MRHEPWVFLAIVLVFSLLVFRAVDSPTGRAIIPPPQNTLAAPPRVIDHRDAWVPSLKEAPAMGVDGERVYIKEGYYVFEDGSFVTDGRGRPIPAFTTLVEGEPFRNAEYYQTKVLRVRLTPVLESCRDSDRTSQGILEEQPKGKSSYFQPGMVTLDVGREVVLDDRVLSRERVEGVELFDRCFSAKDFGYDVPSYRGVVLEANCAALKGLKSAELGEVLRRVLSEDAGPGKDASLLKNFFTVQFCQKSVPLMTSGSLQSSVQFVPCKLEGKQGFCE